MMPWDLWHHLGLRRRSRRRREPAVLWRRGSAQGGMGLASRGGSAAGAKPGFSRGAAVSDPRVELGLFEHHHCAVSGQWPGGS